MLQAVTHATPSQPTLVLCELGRPPLPDLKSKLVTETEVEYKDNHFNKITSVITNTSGGSKLVEGDEMRRLKVDEVIPQRGNFGRLFVNDIHTKKTESLIEDINFPFRFRAIIGTEEVELEFVRPGNYVVTLRIND